MLSTMIFHFYCICFVFLNSLKHSLVDCQSSSSSSSSNDGGSTTTTTTTTQSSSYSYSSSSYPYSYSYEEYVRVHLPTLGTVQGFRGMGMDFFGGIPFAAPPVGTLRWAPPEQPVPWKPHILDATQFGPDCHQLFDPVNNPLAGDKQQMSEDCLYLNIYTPAGASSLKSDEQQQSQDKNRKNNSSNNKGLPVLVWFHGGAFQQGAAKRPEYDGRRLAQEEMVIVVTVNYRLGALGFLVKSDLGLYGNYGLMDQRAALFFVQEYIHVFGGNPNSVTVFGESAGAVMIGLHLQMSPILFHRAILQSNPMGYQFRSIVVADFLGDALQRAVDCRDLECLRSEPAEEILRAQSSLMGIPRSVGDFFAWGPTLTQERHVSWSGGVGGSGFGYTGSATTTAAPPPTTTNTATSTNNRNNDDGGRNIDDGRSGYSISGFGSRGSTNNNIGGGFFQQQPQQVSTLQQRNLFKSSERNRDSSKFSVNVSQPLLNLNLVPDDIPIIIGTNRHEGEMFVHSVFPLTISKPVYWMFVGALFKDSAGRVLKHYRPFVAQLEAEAQAIAEQQLTEEENKQYYMEHADELQEVYQEWLQMNGKNKNNNKNNNNSTTNAAPNNWDYEVISPETIEQLIKTFSSGGADVPFSEPIESDTYGSSSSSENNNNDEDSFDVNTEEREEDGDDNEGDGYCDDNDDYDENDQSTNNTTSSRSWWDYISKNPFQSTDPEKVEERRRLKQERQAQAKRQKALKEAAKVVVDYRPVMSQIINDYLFRCPSWHYAHQLSRNRVGHNINNVFVYRFSQPTHVPGFKECWGKSCHTSELPYVFKAMEIIRSNYSTLSEFAQKEAPEAPSYPYTEMLNVYHEATKARLEAEEEERMALLYAASNPNATMGASPDKIAATATNKGESSSYQTPSFLTSKNSNSNSTTGSTTTSTKYTRSFQRIIKHFFDDYFVEDADEETASDMAQRWVAFARSGDPNYDVSKVEWMPWRYIPTEEGKNNNLDAYIRWNEEQAAAAEMTGEDKIYDIWNDIEEDLFGNIEEGEYGSVTWTEEDLDRAYRRRVLLALNMEVVEEDDLRSELKRTKLSEQDSENAFFARRFLTKLGISWGDGEDDGASSKNKNKKIPKSTIRQVQRIAQEMGVLGRGLQGEYDRTNGMRSRYWDDDFFPQLLELKWPPEGRLVERDCTCDFWERIRCKYVPGK